MEHPINYDSITNFIETEFEPLLDLFENNTIKKIFTTEIEKIDYLYETIELIEFVKSKMEFLCSYFSFHSTTYQNWDYDDFVNMKSQLVEMVRYLNSDIDIIEAQTGNKYFKQYSPKLNKAITKKEIIHSPKQIEDKQILELILMTAENNLFEKNNVAIGEAIHHLSGKVFSAEQIRKDLSEKKIKRFKKNTYQKALQRINILSEELKNELEKIHE